jgi:phage terminase small subunit
MPTNDTLTRKQRAFVAALLAEPTVTAAAASIGVADSTCWRWLRDPTVRAELAARQDSVIDRASIYQA